MNIKIQLEPTDRTDLMCIACGRFQTDLAVMPISREQEPQVGCHKKCMESMHVKKTNMQQEDT